MFNFIIPHFYRILESCSRKIEESMIIQYKYYYDQMIAFNESSKSAAQFNGNDIEYFVFLFQIIKRCSVSADFDNIYLVKLIWHFEFLKNKTVIRN